MCRVSEGQGRRWTEVAPLNEIRCHSMRYGATQRDTAGEEEKTGWDEGGGRVMIFFEQAGFGELVLQVELRGGRL